VTQGDLKGTEICVNQPVAPFLELCGASPFLFLVECNDGYEKQPRSALTLLDGGLRLEIIPTWTDSGHPAYSTLSDKIKQQLLIDGVKGVQHPSCCGVLGEPYQGPVFLNNILENFLPPKLRPSRVLQRNSRRKQLCRQKTKGLD
jgi:hypothetical protein